MFSCQYGESGSFTAPRVTDGTFLIFLCNLPQQSTNIEIDDEIESFINTLHAKIFSRNIDMVLQFIPFLHYDMT